MKAMKKFLVTVMAAIMVFAMAIPSFASTAGTDGSITVENATENATYKAYKILDATYSGSSTDTKVAYTYTASGDTDVFLTDTDSPFKFTATGTPNVYSVKLKSDTTTGEAIGTYLAGFIKDNPTKFNPISSSSSSDNTVVFSGLTYGYYVVTSSVQPATAVSVDTTLKDVTIIDKNQGPTWGDDPGKKPPYDPTDPDGTPGPGKFIIDGSGNTITANDAKIGDTVNFAISINATAYVGSDLATYYYIKDTLDSGFTDAEITSVQIRPIVSDGNGGRTYDTAVDAVYTDIASTGTNGFELRIPFGMKYGTDANILVKYTAKLNSNATIGDAANKNTANFSYDLDSTFNPDNPAYDPKDPSKFPDPDEPTYKPENEKSTYTSTFAFGLTKVDSETKAPLTGAKFAVEFNVEEVSAGVYKYTNATSGDNVIAAGGALSTTNDAKLVIAGLKPGTYSIEEIEAPSGYDVASAKVSFTIADKTEGGKMVYDADNCSPASVGDVNGYQAVNGNFTNLGGIELPSTGGIGTVLFYLIGSLLLIGAIAITIAKRRVNA